MADERVFTIKINGVEESYKNTKRLLDTLNLITDVTAKVNIETDKNTTSTQNNTKASKEKAKALSDEEKAQKKLTDTQAKANKEISQNEIEQVKANIQLRERAKQLQNLAKLELAAKNSPAEFKAELALLNQEWDKVGEGTKEFEELTEKIEILTSKLKDAEAAKGTFSRNVGNYPKEIELLNNSFDKLGNGIHQTTETTKGMLSTFQTGVGIALLFDESNTELGKTLNNIGKVMAIVSALQSANNNLIKNGIIIQKAKAIIDSLVTKGIISQTTAQTALNIATKAFPAIAVIATIGTIIGLLASSRKNTDDATNSTNKYKSSLDGMGFTSEQARDKHDELIRSLRDIQIEIDLTSGKISQYQSDILRLSNTFQDEINKSNESLRKELETINNDYDGFFSKLKTSFINYVSGSQNVSFEQLDKERFEREKKAREAQANEVIGIEEQKNKNLELINARHNVRVEEQNEQARINNLTGQEKTIAQINLNRKKAIDQAIKDNNTALVLIAKGQNVQLVDIAEINKNFDKQIQEAKVSSANETNSKIKEINSKNLEYIQQYEDNVTAIITNEFDRREVETEIRYQREIEKLRNSLKTEKNISDEARAAINDSIKLLEIRLNQDLDKIRKERSDKEKADNKKRLDEQKTLLDIQSTYIQNFYSDIQGLQKEVKGKNGIIDVDATKANLEEANVQLHQYLSMLNNSKRSIEDYYNGLLSIYDKDSIEYVSALNEKEQALRSLENQIKDANAQIVDNTEQSTNLQKQYWKNLYDTLQEYTDKIMSGVTAIFSAANTLLQSQLDAANEKYEAISQKYDEVVAKREESDNRINELEEEAKTARGGRAIVILEQINMEMIANQQLADQEKQLAKEKEKQEKEIAKKEKQMKRVELTQNIIQGISNTALGVTKALDWGFPLGPIFAAIIGAAGAVQVGVMTSQLAKLEDGGLLKGKRHSEGGMRVEGTNIEVEGGEYVVNRDSTNKNLGLIQYINSQRRALGPNDLSSFFSKSTQGMEPPFKKMFETGGQLPDIVNTISIDNEAFVDAIQGIKIEPVVSVTDINNAQNNVIKVDNWTGL